MPAKAEKLNYRKPGFFNKFAELQGVMCAYICLSVRLRDRVRPLARTALL